MLPPAHNQIEYSVSEISASLKRVVEDTFGYVRVRGEISGLKVAASGHVYFSLKDADALLSAVSWRGSVARFSFKPEDGLEVVCSGKISTYAGRSNYQMIVDKMEPAGAGALMALLEKRKAQLAAEGLFDPARKQPIPFMPRVIGVVTSPTGAVIRDILHRIEERFPLHVLVWPVLVQGEGAAEQIAAAIAGFNALTGDSIPRPDVIIVARGGGSLEDLWAFNEEAVVRATAASVIPLISAVGHETDTTLIDYASDLRAPTPTAAAEMAVPVRSEWLVTLSEHASRMNSRMIHYIRHNEERVTGLARGLPNPMQLLTQRVQRLDDWTERLALALPTLVKRKSDALKLYAAQLKPDMLLREISQHERGLSQLAERFTLALSRQLEQRESKLTGLASLFESLNYRSVLARGFAMVTDSTGTLVSSAAAATTHDTLTITFHDGEMKVQRK